MVTDLILTTLVLYSTHPLLLLLLLLQLSHGLRDQKTADDFVLQEAAGLGRSDLSLYVGEDVGSIKDW